MDGRGNALLTGRRRPGVSPFCNSRPVADRRDDRSVAFVAAERRPNRPGLAAPDMPRGIISGSSRNVASPAPRFPQGLHRKHRKAAL